MNDDRNRPPYPGAEWDVANLRWFPDPRKVDSASDDRTVNNTMRHAYRVLSDDEKAMMQRLKDDGLAFHELIASMGNSREISLAKTKVEEAVMWAVKHLTA